MFVVGLVLLALQAPSPSPSASPAPAVSPSPSIEKAEPSTKGLRKSLRATLDAIDVDQMTVRFTDEAGQKKTWPVDRRLAAAAPGRAQDLLKAFQPGDRIYVAYHEDEGHPVITELAKRTAADDEIDKRRSQEKRN